MLHLPLSLLTKAKARTSILVCIAFPAFGIMLAKDGLLGIIAGIIATACFYTLTKIVK